MTDNERHNDARQDIGGDIQQELCHRLPPLPGGWPTRLITVFASNHKAAPEKGPPFCLPGHIDHAMRGEKGGGK